MIEDLISIDVSLIFSSNVYYENHSLAVCSTPRRSLLKNLLGSQVRVRAVPSEAEQLVLSSSHSLLASMCSLLMNEHPQLKTFLQ